MKNIFFLIFSLAVISCSSSKIIDIQRLNDTDKIIFKDGDVIYLTNLDTTNISFHYTADDSVKTKEAKNIILKDFRIEYDSTNADEFFEPFSKQNRDSILTPKELICKKYEKFGNILEGKQWSTMTKYKHKNLTVRKIGWDELDKFVENEIYFRINDSLQIEIPMPKDIVHFCNQIKLKYTDVKYLILFRNFYLTYNIFERLKVSGPKSPDIPVTKNISVFFELGLESDDAYYLAPKVVIDVNRAKILLIDARSHPIFNWDDFIWDLNWMIEEEAEYYNLRI